MQAFEGVVEGDGQVFSFRVCALLRRLYNHQETPQHFSAVRGGDLQVL